MAVLVLQLIVALTNKGVAWPTKKWLAEKLGVCTKTIQRALASLRKWGYLGGLELRKNAIGWCVARFCALPGPQSRSSSARAIRSAPKRPKTAEIRGDCPPYRYLRYRNPHLEIIDTENRDSQILQFPRRSDEDESAGAWRRSGARIQRSG